MQDLNETLQLCLKENNDTKITLRKLDVSNREDFFKYAKEVKNDHKKVNLIINNAGVAM
jgi:NADP-dependent 3-hydroxy acid dehydrogenase YdfG